MYVLFAMALALGLLVLLMHFKVKLGRCMLAAALALTLLLGVTPKELWQSLVAEWQTEPVFLQQTSLYLWISLTALAMFVNVLGVAMKETELSPKLAPALQTIFRSRRLALGAIPAIMGLLPSPGGIMLSAPMVRELGDSLGVERSRQAAINFLFRHQWEPVWPLFPAIPLVQSMLGVSALSLIVHNGVLPLVGIPCGIICLLHSAIPGSSTKIPASGAYRTHLSNFLHALGPIALVAGLYAWLDVPPALGMLLAIILFLLIHKMPIRRWPGIFRAGFQFDFALLIFAAMFFKLSLQAGEAVDSVVQFFHAIHAPPLLILFLLPFTVAALTGVTVATVAMTFPFLIPFIGTGDQCRLGLEALAFSGLLCGLLLTPVHLCLALSTGYFACSLTKIIRCMLLPCACIAGAGLLLALLL